MPPHEWWQPCSLETFLQNNAQVFLITRQFILQLVVNTFK